MHIPPPGDTSQSIIPASQRAGASNSPARVNAPDLHPPRHLLPDVRPTLTNDLTVTASHARIRQMTQQPHIGFAPLFSGNVAHTPATPTQVETRLRNLLILPKDASGSLLDMPIKDRLEVLVSIVRDAPPGHSKEEAKRFVRAHAEENLSRPQQQELVSQMCEADVYSTDLDRDRADWCLHFMGQAGTAADHGASLMKLASLGRDVFAGSMDAFHKLLTLSRTGNHPNARVTLARRAHQTADHAGAVGALIADMHSDSPEQKARVLENLLRGGQEALNDWDEPPRITPEQWAPMAAEILKETRGLPAGLQASVAEQFPSV